MINKDKLARRFSRHSATYDRYAMVQKIMADHLITLSGDSHPKRILEIGSGTGYLTALLKEKYPSSEIIAVDLSEGMIQVAKERLKDDSIRFICGDIETMVFDKRFDLIVSNATFQWFNDLEATLERLKGILEKDGMLCFSTFGDKTFRELHQCYANVQKSGSYSPGQAFFTLTGIKEIVEKIYGEMTNDISEDVYTETFESCMAFFESIKKVGANNAQSAGTARDPHFIRKVIGRYEVDYRNDDGVYATYHGLFITVNQ